MRNPGSRALGGAGGSHLPLTGYVALSSTSLSYNLRITPFRGSKVNTAEKVLEQGR